MSFQKNQKNQNTKMQRKEKDSFLAHHFEKLSQTLKERASSSTSRGSITLEASLATPIFLFAVLCLVYLFEIMALQTSMKSALHAVSREVAEESYVSTMISTRKMEQRMVELIGEDRLERSLIVGGSSGLDCSKSKQYGDTTIMDLSVRYQIEIPIAMFQIPIITQEETIRVKGWTGDGRKSVGSSESIMVYVTDYGLVYHKDIHCSYLELSVRMIEEENIEKMRNENGEKYKECTSCKNASENHSKVYITNYGNRYHQSLSCSKIKRKMSAVPLDDIRGMGGCSKCVE